MRDWFKSALLNLYLPSFSKEERKALLEGRVSARELLERKKRVLPFDKETLLLIEKVRRAYSGSVAIEAVRRFGNRIKEGIKEIRKLWKLSQEKDLVYKLLYLSFLAHATGFHLIPEFTRYRVVLDRLEEEKFLTFYVFNLYKELSSYMWKCYFSEKDRAELYPNSSRAYVDFEFLLDYFPSFVEEEEELEQKALDEEFLLLSGEEEEKELSKEQISQLTTWVKNQLTVIKNEEGPKKRSKKLRELEEKLSLSRGYLTRFLRGKENLSLKKLLQLADLLGCDFSALGIPSSVLKEVEL